RAALAACALDGENDRRSNVLNVATRPAPARLLFVDGDERTAVAHRHQHLIDAAPVIVLAVDGREPKNGRSVASQNATLAEDLVIPSRTIDGWVVSVRKQPLAKRCILRERSWIGRAGLVAPQASVRAIHIGAAQNDEAPPFEGGDESARIVLRHRQ